MFLVKRIIMWHFKVFSLSPCVLKNSMNNQLSVSFILWCLCFITIPPLLFVHIFFTFIFPNIIKKMSLILTMGFHYKQIHTCFMLFWVFPFIFDFKTIAEIFFSPFRIILIMKCKYFVTICWKKLFLFEVYRRRKHFTNYN